MSLARPDLHVFLFGGDSDWIRICQRSLAVRDSRAAGVDVFSRGDRRVVGLGSETAGQIPEHTVSPSVEIMAGYWGLHTCDLRRAADGLAGHSGFSRV